VYKNEGGKWIPCGVNVCDKFDTPDTNTFVNQADALRKAMTALGANIETGSDEYPEVEELLAAFAGAIGITNIAILKRRKEA
jgi:hypothetical protein